MITVTSIRDILSLPKPQSPKEHVHGWWWWQWQVLGLSRASCILQSPEMHIRNGFWSWELGQGGFWASSMPRRKWEIKFATDIMASSIGFALQRTLTMIVAQICLARNLHHAWLISYNQCRYLKPDIPRERASGSQELRMKPKIWKLSTRRHLVQMMESPSLHSMRFQQSQGAHCNHLFKAAIARLSDVG